jgi:hypothetical protein
MRFEDIKAGIKVRVMRSFRDGAGTPGWLWKMDATIGRVGTVEYTTKGIDWVRVQFGEEGKGWSYLPEVLAPVLQRGDKVKIVSNQRAMYKGRWVGPMDDAVGTVAEVLELEPFDMKPELGWVLLRTIAGTWWFPPEALAYAEVEEEEKPAPKPKAKHKFVPGDVVQVYRKVKQDPWITAMDATVGLRGVVHAADSSDVRVVVENGKSYWYPWSALKRYKEE